MPIYTYENQTTLEKRDVIQTMNEDHVYFGDGIEEEAEWKRVFTPLSFSMASSASIKDPFKKESFLAATEGKKMTLGDMWDLSGEMSQQRAEQAGGEDPVQREHFDAYEKKNGVKHHDDKKKVVEEDGVKITLD